MIRSIDPSDREWPAAVTQANEKGAFPPIKKLRLLGLPLDPTRSHIAIVGTRRASAMGIDIATDISARLAEAGFVIVSGMAKGIDGAAHVAALDVGGTSIAVLGCGADICYPARHRALKQRLEQQGTVISEYPDGTTTQPWQFPERNRIVAALSCAVIVVQGGPKSGALITAELAWKLQRPVLAVPGNPLCTESAGCHQLIQSSTAALVTSAEDVFRELALGPTPTPVSSLPVPTAVVPPGLSEDDLQVLELLDELPRPAGALAARGSGGAPSLGAAGLCCSRLEIRGLAAKRRAGYTITPLGVRIRNAVALEHQRRSR